LRPFFFCLLAISGTKSAGSGVCTGDRNLPEEAAMFADLLCESPWENRSHRGWTTLASFAVQAFALGVLLLIPFLYTEGLPRLQLMAALVAPAPPPGPPPAPVQGHIPVVSASNMAGAHLLTPPSIPRTIAQIDEAQAPPSGDAVPGWYVPGSIPGSGARNGVFDSIGRSISVVVPPAPVAHAPITSSSMEAYLVHRVQPEYPPLARAARIQGSVLVRAVIAKDGTIENLRVISGHPMLVPSALEAIRQWRYRPYVLNGEPVEVETQVTVNFVLAGG
jgi:protein TonB